MIALVVLTSVGIGIYSPLLWSMYADVADYHTDHFGTSATGLIFSSGTMSQKFGTAISGSLIALFLGWAGANMITDKMGNTMIDPASVTDSVLTMVWSLFSAFPSIHRIPADGSCLEVPYPQKIVIIWLIILKKGKMDNLKERCGCSENNILNYWIHKVKDEENGGFYGRVDGNDQVHPEAEKGAVMNARILLGLFCSLQGIEEARVSGGCNPCQGVCA